ncbi:MAG: succinate dehydrogenase, cytochrome b556 subunit [Janthinobacterium lividum]
MSSQRPLSPHLQIYRFQIVTMLMSITHRITGVILSSSLLLLAIMLTCLIKGPQVYEHFFVYSQHLLSQIYLFVLCYSFYYHLCNGVRHLFWDMGYGFDMPQVRVSGYLTLGTSIILTLITWFMV